MVLQLGDRSQVPRILGGLIGCTVKIEAACPANLDQDSYGSMRKKGRLGPDSSGRAFITEESTRFRGLAIHNVNSDISILRGRHFEI